MLIRWNKTDPPTEFPKIERPMMAEVSHVERLSGVAGDKFTSVESMMAIIYISARRHDPKLLTWQDIGEATMDDFDWVDEPDDAALQAADEADAEGVDDPPAEAE